MNNELTMKNLSEKIKILLTDTGGVLTNGYQKMKLKKLLKLQM